MQDIFWVWSLGWGDSLEEDMTTHSSILAWRISWTEETGGLQSPVSPWGCKESEDWAQQQTTGKQNPGKKQSAYLQEPLGGLCFLNTITIVVCSSNSIHVGWIRHLPQTTLEKEMATHSSILAWRISWTKETGRLNRLSMLASDSWCWSSFHALDYHSYTFSDVSVQVFCPFFSLSCLAAWALRVIYIFWILVLYQLCVLKIFYVILWLDFSFSW